MEWLIKFPEMDRNGLREFKKAVDNTFTSFSRNYGESIENFFDPLLNFLVSLEKLSRRKMQFFNMSSKQKAVQKIRLRGLSNILAFLSCLAPVLLGFALPLIILLEHSMSNPQLFMDKGLIDATFNTVFIGTIAAIFTVILSIDVHLFTFYNVYELFDRLLR